MKKKFSFETDIYIRYDFSGPNGVWTLEKQGKKPDTNISFSDAIPSKCHMALKALLDSGHIKFIVSQNIDGLHLRSGVARKHLAELHGNMFIENCNKCRRWQNEVFT